MSNLPSRNQAIYLVRSPDRGADAKFQEFIIQATVGKDSTRVLPGERDRQLNLFAACRLEGFAREARILSRPCAAAIPSYKLKVC